MLWNLGVKPIAGKLQFHADRVVRFGAGLLLGNHPRQVRAPTRRAGKRRGRDRVRVIIVATIDAADVAEALDLAWWTFRKAAGENLAGWALTDAEAEVRSQGR